MSQITATFFQHLPLMVSIARPITVYIYRKNKSKIKGRIEVIKRMRRIKKIEKKTFLIKGDPNYK
jgi:hypothetical protein